MASKTLQRLMDVAPRGQPLDPQILRDCGISPQQTSYLVNAGHGQLVILDQADNSQRSIDIPTRDPKDKVPSRFSAPNRPSLRSRATSRLIGKMSDS